MTHRPILSACLALGVLAAPCLAPDAFAQRGRAQNPFEDSAPSAPNSTYQGPQGFSFQGDELPPSYDRKYVGRPDSRYSQTYQQQQVEAQKPGGGCLKYGAAGALGGHLAGHGVMGALAGCAVGTYVRHRDKNRIEEQQQGQRQ
ncbi:MAG: hypothetical protein ACRYGM_00975 [Janthinobacterium lividum]